jgi:hypothetical protein
VIVALLAAWSIPQAKAFGRLPFQVLLNADGSGQIFMNDQSSPEWKACKPDLTSCTLFAKGSFSTGDAPPETVFWGGEDLLTPLWKGNVHATAPPSVTGAVRADHVVTPIAAQWGGGWENDWDQLTLSICRTAAGQQCVTINHEGGVGECGAGGATLIDPAFAGWYLQVVDRRYGADTAFAGVGHPFYYWAPEVIGGPTVSVALVGKIAPATGPPRAGCSSPPPFSALITRKGSAEVGCPIVACHAELIARRDRISVRMVRRLVPAPGSGRGGSATLRLRPSALKRLPRGPVHFTVKINGRVLARRTLRLGRSPAKERRSTARSSASGKPEIHVSLNPDGSGTLTAEPAGAWEWKNCKADLTSCVAVGTGSQITTVGATEGTLFTATLNGRILISPRWDGNVHFAQPPSLRGTIAANEFVFLWNGDWRGGWPEQLGIAQLAACRNADGSDCITLSNTHGGCSSPGGVVLDPVLTGWYLRLAEQVEIIGSSPFHLHPEEEAPFPASAIASVAMLGQIAPATGPPSVKCSVPPQLGASISSAGVASIRCGLGCVAVLRGRSGARSASIKRDIPPMLFSLPAKELPRIRLPRGAIGRFSGRHTTLSLFLNGALAAHRKVPTATLLRVPVKPARSTSRAH